MQEVILGLFSAIMLAAFGFVVQVNSKVAKVEAKNEDLVALIEAKFEGLDRRLERIEVACNGYLRDHKGKEN